MTQRRLFLLLSIAIIVAGWAAQSDHWHWFGSTPELTLGAYDLARHVGALTVLGAAILWLLLRGAGEDLTSLGLGFRELGTAVKNPLVLRIIGFLLLVGLVIGNIQMNLAKHDTGSAMVDAWLREPGVSPTVIGWLHEPNGFFWTIVVSIVGAFREELERAFCLSRFQTVFGTPGLVIAIPVDAFLFAHQHLYQGHVAALHAAILAVTMSAVFLRSGRVVEPMLIHAGLNLTRIVLIFSLADS